MTFMHNPMREIAACGFFVVPAVTFQCHYCFVVLSIGRRRSLHVNDTTTPAAKWTLLQGASGASGRDSQRVST